MIDQFDLRYIDIVPCLVLNDKIGRTGIRTPVIGLEGRGDIQTTLYGQTQRERISSISITVVLHICDSESVCEPLSASIHSHNACRTTILPSQNQDILLAFLGALVNPRLKHLNIINGIMQFFGMIQASEQGCAQCQALNLAS